MMTEKTGPTLHPEVQALAALLQEMRDLLQADGYGDWAATIQNCLGAIENSDAYGLYRFLGLFGGMGSLNDLVLQSGGVMSAEGNERLDILRHQSWTLANKLKHELPSAG